MKESKHRTVGTLNQEPLYGNENVRILFYISFSDLYLYFVLE